MVNTRQFSGSTYMQDMTKSHTFSAKNQGSTYTPIRLIRREIRCRYIYLSHNRRVRRGGALGARAPPTPHLKKKFRSETSKREKKVPPRYAGKK